MSNIFKQNTTRKNGNLAAVRYGLLLVVFAVFAYFAALPIPTASACCEKIGLCAPAQCSTSERIIKNYHVQAENIMHNHIADEFTKHRTELTDNFLRNHFIPAAQHFTEQFSAIIHHHAQAIGRLMDAKNHLESQQALEVMKFEATKRYQPSASFCWFGTNVRSLHNAESKAAFNSAGFNAQTLKHDLGKKNTSSAGSKFEFLNERWNYFTKNYCNTRDNYFKGGSTGLVLACNGQDAPIERQNNDLRYGKLLDAPRTIKVDLTNDTANQETEDLIALGRNLYGSDILTRAAGLMSTETSQKNYLLLRSIAAKRSVAEASFSAIIGLKSEGGDANTKQFLQELVKGIGGDPSEIGDKPSYYAQLEILSKRIYQNPHFYANLYDSPENTARKSAALKAIELMLERAISESETRQEMIMSVLLASDLRGHVIGAEQGNIRSTTGGK